MFDTAFFSLKRYLFFVGFGLFLIACSKEDIPIEDIPPPPKPTPTPKPKKPFVIKDALFKDQWYLENTGQVGIKGLDINVIPVWKAGYTGKGVTVGVLDALADYHHPELKDNLPPENVVTYNGDVTAYCKDDHGTAVASLIGAKADAVGMRGVAYDSKLFSYGMLSANGTLKTNPAQKMFSNIINILQRPERKDVAVYNCSFSVPGEHNYTAITDNLRLAMTNVAKNGFNGKGSGLVFAAGNGGLGATASNSTYLNHPAVLGVNNSTSGDIFMDGSSTSGMNIWVYAPAGSGQQLVATNITCGTNATPYRKTFGATSGAAPLVSGVVALLRQARPQLTWRDIKLIIAESADKNDKGKFSPTTTTTGRMYHDPSKKQTYSKFKGFGMLDAKAALDLARVWKPLPPQKILTKTVTFNRPTPYGSTTHEFNIAIKNTGIRFIESVVVDIDYDFDQEITVNYFTLKLLSPDGKEAAFYDYLNSFGQEILYSQEKLGILSLLSNTFLGSDVVSGVWQLRLRQKKHSHTKLIKGIKSVKITIRGH